VRRWVVDSRRRRRQWRRLPPSTHTRQAGTSTLTEIQRAILDFERYWSLSLGAKDQAIRDQLGLEPDQYYQQIYALVDDLEAMRYAPTVVNRYWRWRKVRYRNRFRPRV